LAIQRRLVEAVEITENQIHLIRLKGIFDASTVSEFEKVVSYLLARNFFKMVVDLGGVEFISSAGWGAFTAELRRVRENDGDIKLSGMGTDIFDVFLLLELDSFIKAYDTEEEALTAFLQPAPEPEPEVRPLVEMAPPVVKAPRVMPSEETKTRLPAVFETTSPAIFQQPRQNDVEYQETHTLEGETFEIESEVSAFDQQAENSLADQENYAFDDNTLAIEAKQPMSTNGAEMYELLLTSGRPASVPDMARKSLPPPSFEAPHDDGHQHGAADSIVEKFNDVDFGSSSEFDFYAHETTADDGRHEETQEFTDLISTSDLHFSGHEPIIDADRENTEFSEPMTESETEFSKSLPMALGRHDNEAFSELSLDLESHLHQQGRMSEKREALAEFHDLRSEKENGFSSGETTQEFDQLVFAPEGEFPDRSSATFHENEDAEFSETGLSAPFDFSEPAPAFDNGNPAEDLNLKKFSTSLKEFAPRANSAHEAAPERDDEYETQDIRDPWILEEIDTLPEEYEMDGVADEDTPIAASEFLSGDFEFDLAPPAFAPVNDAEHELAAGKFDQRDAAPSTIFSDEVEARSGDAGFMQNLSIARGDKFASFAAPVDELFAQPIKKKNRVAPTTVEFGSDDDNQVVVSHQSTAKFVDADTNGAANFSEKPKPNGKSSSATVPMTETDLPKIPMSSDISEMIRGIIAAYPHYGPAMIGKFLEDRVEPPVFLSRSTIYRYLRETDLNTRKKRFEYAGQELDLTSADATDVAEEA